MTTKDSSSNTITTTLDLQDIDTCLFDLDGVLWRAGKCVEGASETLKQLLKLGKSLLYVTNNGSRTRHETAEYISSMMNIDVKDEHIISTAPATAEYLASTAEYIAGNRKRVYVLGMQGLCDELEKVGIGWIGGPNDEHIGKGPAEMMAVELEKDVGAVVVSWHHHFSYGNLSMVVRYLKEQNVQFIATNRDRTLPCPGGIELPGAGSMVAAVEHASGCEAITVGKPSQIMVNATLPYIPDPQRAVMVGDRDSDIEFGSLIGCKTMLVLSGASKATDQWIAAQKPTCIAQSITQGFACADRS